MDLVSIGEFARLARLSPKALRLYDQSGLLSPARVETSTGYRWYSTGQLETARLVAVLPQLGMPLAQIAPILPLDDAARAEQISAWWADVQDEHAARRELAGFLVDRLSGRKTGMSEQNRIALRELPQRQLLSLMRHARSDEVVTLGRQFIRKLREASGRPADGAAGAPFVIYYGEVSDDSDGPIEWCWPVADDQAELLAAQLPELTLRTDAAHEEAFVHQGLATQVAKAQAHLAIEGLFVWASEQHRQPTGGIRQLYLFNPANQGAGPDCDFALPLR